MNRSALCVGINDYGGNSDLYGCVNDARDWGGVLQNAGYATTTMLDGQATKMAILETLRGMVSRARFGDRIVFTYSGHGTWVPDFSGDEPDGRDEALCPADFMENGVITDDELGEVVSRKRFGVRFTIVSDSCHSGSVSRFMMSDPKAFAAYWPNDPPVVTSATHQPLPRFISPTTFLTGEQLRVARRLDRVEAVTRPRNSTGAVLFSGSADDEYAYDAWINGRYNGAFTAAAVACIRLAPNSSYAKWHGSIRRVLPSSEYPQTPLMYASLWQRRWSL